MGHTLWLALTVDKEVYAFNRIINVNDSDHINVRFGRIVGRRRLEISTLNTAAHMLIIWKLLGSCDLEQSLINLYLMTTDKQVLCVENACVKYMHYINKQSTIEYCYQTCVNYGKHSCKFMYDNQ